MPKVLQSRFVVAVLGEVPRDVFERALELIEAVTNALVLGMAHPYLVGAWRSCELAASEL